MRRSTTFKVAAFCGVTVGGWMIFSVSARSLPGLSAHSVSNRTFQITWPYTNAGFSLQESGTLTGWQSSALTPVFDSNSAVFTMMLRLTGINRTTDELRLPAETASSTGLDCVSNAPAIWAANGFTPSNLLSAWSNILNAFNASFPDKTFCVAIIATNAFPQIDDNTNIITGQAPDENEPLLQLAGRLLPGRLVVQYNFLLTSNAANPAAISAAQDYGSLPAFQVNEWLGATGGAACGGTVTNPTPCDDAAFLQMLETGIHPLGQTNPLRAQYIEVFATNAIAFTNAILQAHQELFTPP